MVMLLYSVTHTFHCFNNYLMGKGGEDLFCHINTEVSPFHNGGGRVAVQSSSHHIEMARKMREKREEERRGGEGEWEEREEEVKFS